MTERQAEYKTATRISGWQLRPQTVKAIRCATKGTMLEWRTIAQQSHDEYLAATQAIKQRKTSKADIRQKIADEAGNGESTIRLWEDLEKTFCDQLDELPKNAILTWSQLRWFKSIAKRHEIDPDQIFIELLNEAISRRDREGDESGENILFPAVSVLKHMAQGDKELPDAKRYLAQAQNCMSQYNKRIAGTGYAKFTEDANKLNADIAALYDRHEQAEKGK